MIQLSFIVFISISRENGEIDKLVGYMMWCMWDYMHIYVGYTYVYMHI